MGIIRVDDTTGAVLETMDPGTFLELMIDYFRTAQTSITDFNEGSEARNLLGAASISQYELYFYIGLLFEMGYPQTAKGDYLDAIGVLVNCYRQSANKSHGNVTISIDNAPSVDVVIPEGSTLTCSSDYDLRFITLQDITLLAGTTSITGPAEAITGGLNGNVANGVIDTFETNDTGYLLYVTNSSAFTGGTDTEEDEEYRARILEAGKSTQMGNMSWYKTLVGNITGVHDSSVINMPFDHSFNVKILVNGDTKPTPTDILEDVEEIFTLDENKIGGIKVLIDKPSYTIVNLNVTLSVKSGYSFSTVKANVESNITDYFQGGTTTYNTVYPGLDIGENVVISTLQLIIGNTEGVQDWTITNPTDNILMGSETAAQLGTIIITEA